MAFQMKDVLSSLGPSASLVFAAWIFLSFLQTRYTGAYQLYRELISELRERGEDQAMSSARRGQVAQQIRLYRRRCDLMRRATNIGVIAAITLVIGIVLGGLQLTFLPFSIVKGFSVVAMVSGLLLVAVASMFVLVENTELVRAFDSELGDLHGRPEWKQG